MVKSPAMQRRIFTDTLKSARLGLRDAQYEVGLMYANGSGVIRDMGQALSWISQAAERGLASAQYLLATRYAAGIDLEHDPQKAMFWFQKAAEQGHAKALFRLGQLYELPQLDLANSCLYKAANLGLAEAQFALAVNLSDGKGLERDAPQAMFWLQKAAEQGLVSAQIRLGQRLSVGQDCDADVGKARYWYRKAVQQNSPVAFVALEYLDASGSGRTKARGRGKRKTGSLERRLDTSKWGDLTELGDADAAYHMGLMNEFGMGVSENVDLAEAWYRVAARQKHVLAQLALGKRFEGLPSITAKEDAVFWYEQAAAQGNCEAQFALGRIYCAGEIVVRDFVKGVAWYTRASQQGDGRALLTLGNLYRGGLDEMAVACFKQAADQGVAEAQYLLAQHLRFGKGTTVNLQESLYWYRQAANQDHVGAQSALGGVYLAGIGTVKDFPAAFEWFSKAAEKGDPAAQWNLGGMYASGGKGVKRDIQLAFAWCKKAADQDFLPAQSTLGVLFALVKDHTKAALCWVQAAERGDPEAQYNLGVVIAKGEGIEKDVKAAFSWFCKAANQGVLKAQARLGLMYASGEGVALDAIEAHKWFFLAAMGGDAASQSNLKRSEFQLSSVQIAEGRRRASDWSGKSESRQPR